MLDAIAALREAIAAGASAPQPVAEAMARHLGVVTVAALPQQAQPIWIEIAASLKADPARVLPPAAIAAVRAWPSPRVTRLVERLHNLHAVLEHAEDERRHDAIRADLQRAYL